jgi:hypothetical protein
METNPTQKEPVWIRDNQIVKVEFDESLNARGFDWIAEICAGETNYCEHCGEKFPLWPPQDWADHVLTHHAGVLTHQAHNGTLQMSSRVRNEAQITFFAMMFAQRVSLRRRAWQLGYAKAEAEKPRLVS